MVSDPNSEFRIPSHQIAFYPEQTFSIDLLCRRHCVLAWFQIQSGFVFALLRPTTIDRRFLAANTLEALSIHYLFDPRVRNVPSCSEPSQLISDHMSYTSGSVQICRLDSFPTDLMDSIPVIDPLVYASR